MEVTSLNVGARRTQPKGNELETTGIYKLPTAESVPITSLGIPGDFVCDQKNHGGPDQAIFIYGTLDYAWWSNQLGLDLAPGTFGENLTISGLQSAHLNIGDRLEVGSVTLEITAPRTPCSTLARRMGDSTFVRKYRLAERPGLYCRVIREGEVRADDGVAYLPYCGATISALELFRERFRADKDEARLLRILAAPLAVRARAKIEADLQKLRSPS